MREENEHAGKEKEEKKSCKVRLTEGDGEIASKIIKAEREREREREREKKIELALNVGWEMVQDQKRHLRERDGDINLERHVCGKENVCWRESH